MGCFLDDDEVYSTTGLFIQRGGPLVPLTSPPVSSSGTHAGMKRYPLFRHRTATSKKYQLRPETYE